MLVGRLGTQQGDRRRDGVGVLTVFKEIKLDGVCVCVCRPQILVNLIQTKQTQFGHLRLLFLYLSVKVS